MAEATGKLLETFETDGIKVELWQAETGHHYLRCLAHNERSDYWWNRRHAELLIKARWAWCLGCALGREPVANRPSDAPE